jgi:hypothetical protein
MTTALTALAKNPPRQRLLAVADERAHQAHPLGRLDRSDIDDVLDVLPQMTLWPTIGAEGNLRKRGARQVLEWLATYPGDGWQDRWLAADIRDRSWRDIIDQNLTAGSYEQLTQGMRSLLVARVIRPGYEFLQNYKAFALYDDVRAIISPGVFEQASNAAAISA